MVTGLDTQRRLTPTPTPAVTQQRLMCALKNARIRLTVAAAFMILFITKNVTDSLWYSSDSATGQQLNSGTAVTVQLDSS